jgi:hypothetical protein
MKKLYSILKRKFAAAAVVLLLTATTTFAQTDVLVCGAASPQGWLDDVQNKLIATGAFNSVTTYNLYSTGTPTLAYLQGFDAVLVYTDYGCQDPTTFGNNLAAYIDGGGGVVNCVFSNASVLINGAFNTTAYQVIVPNNGQNSSPQLTLGTILDPCHAIIQGITSFDGGSSSYRSSSNTLAPGATFVANWSNGDWLVAQKTGVGPMNARRADLNFYPPSSTVRSDFWDAATQGGQLMANALLWVAGVTNSLGTPSTPGAITGTAVICEGTTTSYSISSVAGATSYTWAVPAGSVIQSGQGTTSISVLTGSTSGNITVTADNACGSSPAQTFVLTINPLPSVGSISSPAAVVCSGDNVTLSGTGASSYVWSGGITDAVPFSATATINYTVTGTDANGCVNTATHLITVNPLPTVVANATSTTICDGDPVTLTGSGATSYTWAAAISVTDNVAFNPTATDTYTVTGTDANGCMNTDMITVTVNPLPVVVANSTASAVCTGSPVTLNGSGASTYTWTGAVTDNVAFNPTVTDTYTVTGTDANGCSNTDMITVTVNSLPTVVANATATTICEGSPVTLSGSGASTYTWTGSVTDNVAFNPTVTDTYTVTGTDANGCTNTDMITVNVNPAPAVVGNATSTSVCAGSSVTLTGSGATSYTWTGGVTDGVSFVPASTDTYTVTGTDANGCTNTDEVTVTVNPMPTVTGSSSATTMCVDDANATLTGSPSGGTWFGIGVSGSTFDPGIAGVGTQTLPYNYTDANGCSGSASVTITVNACVGVVENSLENGVNVYPNPNNGEFTIAIDANVGDLKIEIVDMQGRVVYLSQENNVQAGFTTRVSLNEMAEGIYMVRLTSAEAQRMMKVVVQE